MLRAIGTALRSPWSALAGLVAGAGLFALAVWLPNLGLIWSVITSGSMSTGGKLGFLWSSLGAIGTNFTTSAAWLTGAAALLFGLNVTVAVRYLRQRAAQARSGGASLAGVLLALLGVGCSSCGTIVLAALLGTGAAASLVAHLPLAGEEFTILAVAMLAATLAVTARKLAQPSCPIDLPARPKTRQPQPAPPVKPEDPGAQVSRDLAP